MVLPLWRPVVDLSIVDIDLSAVTSIIYTMLIPEEATQQEG
jgi:hypothetical protein